MRFLCLHGVGTNSHVLETQFSTISYEMERHHEFEFVEGTEVEPVAPEIKAFYPSRDTFYGYYRNEPASILKAIDQLHTYIEEEGPFEGVIGFSQGAALLSTYLIQWNNTWPERPFPVQCAIFFSASRPFDVPSLYAGQLQWVDVDACGALLSLPTAHIWGAKDETYKDQCELLSAMCAEEGREVYVHGEGHEIPGPRAKQDVQGCVRVIRRVIEKASLDV